MNESDTQSTRKSPLGITIGEPSGIGPDILLKLCVEEEFAAPLIAISDINLLLQRAAILNLNIMIEEVFEIQLHDLKPSPKGHLYVLNVPAPETHIVPGTPSSLFAQWVLATIQKATLLCAENKLAAMITGPVQKSIINDAGIPFSGHTEFIADCLNQHTSTSSSQKHVEPLMMLTSGQMLAHPLRVALVTTHHALLDIPKLITYEKVLEKITALHQDLTRLYGILNPIILVSGLNPHAGEQGHLGMEEIQQITPALEKARAMGINAIGPLPADTLFTPRYLKDADAVLAMYHDQGLSVLKYASFGGGINVTLGLNIVRTSVDHGTALSLAGSGQADPSSLKAAILEALFIISRK